MDAWDKHIQVSAVSHPNPVYTLNVCRCKSAEVSRNILVHCIFLRVAAWRNIWIVGLTLSTKIYFKAVAVKALDSVRIFKMVYALEGEVSAFVRSLKRGGDRVRCLHDLNVKYSLQIKKLQWKYHSSVVPIFDAANFLGLGSGTLEFARSSAGSGQYDFKSSR